MLDRLRRRLLIGAGWSALAASRLGRAHAAPPGRPAAGPLPDSAKPLPLAAVRLLPSDFATAVDINRAYLLRLDPDRLLHHFRAYAGIATNAAPYGGWESDTLAGHTLGHYLSALALMYAQTGAPQCRARADYIVAQLAIVQEKRGSGYVGALGRRRRDGSIVDGEEIFPELVQGRIQSKGFDLNGAWSPLYTVHKLFAGLLDVDAAWDNPAAMEVALGLARYFERVFAALDAAQMQRVLACEYGGLNESFAELGARTGDPRWRSIAERLYDDQVLAPLAAQRDELADRHANTQVPKIVGLARLYELTGNPRHAAAARFFWSAVTQHHSYVIGGNADREYFSEPDSIADHITEQTCEHCNTYNMLKLTEHLFGWRPDGALFDYYERAQLNHVMAAQNPGNAGFSYMTPLLTGADREYSSPHDDAFWCCVGTGMESHAKHGKSIFWEGADTLFVNLYIAAEASWETRACKLLLDTRYPFETESRLTIAELPGRARFKIALRVPAWAARGVSFRVNGRTVSPDIARGYALIDRHWQRGDHVGISMPLELRLESAAGDRNTVAILRGPLVLAADLGDAGDEPWSGVEPALVGDDPLSAFRAVAPEKARFSTQGGARPADLAFVPFYRQYERRSAVYFKRYTEAQWKTAAEAYAADQARARASAARSVDVMPLGDTKGEREHALVSQESWPDRYRGHQGREARTGGFFEFTLAVIPGPLTLQATYWGNERDRTFDISIDGIPLSTQRLDADRPGKFFDVRYPVPESLTAGKRTIRVRFEPKNGGTAGPVFGIRLFAADDAHPR